MAEAFNLQTVLRDQNNYVQRKYTADENAQAAMAQRELEKAEQAVQSQVSFLGLTLEEKIKDLLVPERVWQEFKDVAFNTLFGAADPFLDWLEENEIYYSENLFTQAIQSDAKQLFYTKMALSKEASSGEVGQTFVATY